MRARCAGMRGASVLIHPVGPRRRPEPTSSASDLERADTGTIDCDAMSVRGPIGAEASTAARYEAVVRVSEALAAYREHDALFRGLARELRPVLLFSFLGLALYDEGTQRVTPHVLE